MDRYHIVLLEWRPEENLFKDSLGLQYIAAVLRASGFKVDILVYERKEIEKVADKVIDYNPDILGIQFYSYTPKETLWIGKRVKEKLPMCHVLLGGHAATLHGESLLRLNDYIDFIIYGEGENTFRELAERLSEKQDINDCKGIIYRDNDGQIIRNSPRRQIKNLDELPFPVKDLHNADKDDKVGKLFNIQTSRGCYGNCSFCVEVRIVDKSLEVWRGRSMENVTEEMESICKEYPNSPVAFSIIDSAFEDPDPIEKGRIKQFLTLMKQKQLKCGFSIFTRAESWKEKDKELIKQLKEAGLFKVQIGFESGSNRILKLFNKRARVEDSVTASKLFKEQGINVFGFLIMFHPYITIEDLYVNALFLKKVDMAYYPEMWFHKVYVDSDARIFNQIQHDNLVIGKSENGFFYEYDFMDKRVVSVSKCMQRFSEMEGPVMFQKFTVKVDNEVLLYNIWKNTYTYLLDIQKEMNEFEILLKNAYSEIGDRQYEYFIHILDYAEDERFTIETDKIINEWNYYLLQKTKELEKMWIINRVSCSRKKVRII
ncbi:MAG: B12-binding domain-containing radical SAM protein [Lachnospiraceae bacterium]|nr:B12-binding domain-containing radical SAM protein [Lachnospiraceae bacterium]